LYEE
jgi:hypothetical protein